MSKAGITQQSSAEITESHPADAAPVWSEDSFADNAHAQRDSLLELPVEFYSNTSGRLLLPTEHPVAKDKNSKPRFGLPEGFISRLSRYGRAVLFADNVYRLPDGGEFIPQPPSGTLGSRNHRYALLTPEQYEKRERGSVYVRADGRIFNYAYDHGALEGEIFDTGFTIHDLERTGRYAPQLKSRASVSRNERKKKGARRKGRK